MFKLESYITPILLSYVDKYINNFKLEDSQVSLWGGEASFHNLELNLQVLEQELQLPFSFVSGSIRELLIHVPWTKLASEPITITINTIECILNLKGKDSATRAESSPKPKERHRKPHGGKNIEAPQGYVQLLIKKIVSNIRINCNNVILKYVEEDIVLSMNIKLLKFESANNKWEPAYTDVSQAEVILRKVITVNDLTLCLDKRNASGKIEVYQEPMLYRCSMTMHFLRHYFSATARKASTTRLDIYCNNMEFSMTEQQVPMLMRLLMLLYALQQKQLKPENYVSAANLNTLDATDDFEHGVSWTGWAWSYVSSVLPAPWDEEDNEHMQTQKGHTLHFGFFVDSASVTFKVSEMSSERGTYYAHKKLRYSPMLSLQLQGIYSESIIHGLKWFNCSGGISQAVLLPVGLCSCSYLEVVDENTLVHYLKIGSETNAHKADSLFDAEAAENKGQRRHYNTSWDYHMTVNSESVLLERTPAFSFDYLYQMELSSDVTSDILSDLGSDHEYSSVPETSSLRVCFGPFKLRLCSGLFHRIGSLKVAASYYDYQPYYIPKPDLPLQDLLPPSEEDFDALNEFISSRSTRITFFAPIIELVLMDHPYFKPTKGCLFRKKKKSPTQGVYAADLAADLPKLTIECQFLDISITFPMYVNRLVHTTCQLPDAPKKLFNACFSKQTIKIMSLCSRLILKPQSHTLILTPSSMSYSRKAILKPQYWTNPNVSHIETVFESESITLNSTNAKMMVIAFIIMKMVRLDSEGAVKMMRNTSMLTDASKDNEFPYIELCIESIRFKKVITNSTVCIDMSLGSVKSFILEPGRNKDGSKLNSLSSKDLQQVLFLSGPEPKTHKKAAKHKGNLEELPLFTATIQYPINPDGQRHPPILLFNLQEMRICIDPLLCRWLLYNPKKLFKKVDILDPHRHKVPVSTSEKSSNIAETPRKINPQLGSVHSNSDREKSNQFRRIQTHPIEETVDLQERIYNVLKKWFDVWKGMFLYGDISQCTIYFPLVSLSAVGSQGIQEAVEAAVNKDHAPDIMILTLPFANVRSAHRQSIVKYLKVLPVTLPKAIWSCERSSFPWTMSISDLSCYTIQYGNKLTFLKPVSLSATVGLSTRPTKSEAAGVSTSKDIASLGVCVHIDMTPVVISTSEVQIYLFASILYGLTEVTGNFFPVDSTVVPTDPEMVPPLLTKSNSTMSPIIIRDTTLESTSEKTPSTSAMLPGKIDSDSVKLTAWVQWTITRFTIELLSSENNSATDDDMDLQNRLKLVVDAEDIVSSLDFQSVYLQIKSKIGSFSIQQYKRSTPSAPWLPGSFSGVVMKLHEDISTGQRHEDNGFISITITRASCQHTHTLWGAIQKTNSERKRTDVNPQLLSQHRYITEVVINVQPIDLVLSLKTLRSFYLVMVPLLQIPVHRKQKPVASHNLSTFNNQSLPLAYLECQDIRVIMPSAELSGSGSAHDIIVFQVQKICLNPSAVNPICRNPIRSDIYEQAAHARILHIPGSEVEDRQYQLDLIGISLCTGIWEDIQSLFSQSGSSKLANLRGRSENPALEWNNLEQGQPNLTPTFNLWPVTEKFDISVIAAPAMIYKESTVICGHSLEVNFVSDIYVNLSLSQIRLLSSLLSEFLLLVEPLASSDGVTVSKIKFPYSTLDKSFLEAHDIENIEILRDSGIDTSDIKSMASSKVIKSFTGSDKQVFTRLGNQSHSNSAVPFDALVTAGKISLGLYHVDDTKISGTKQKNKKRKLVKIADDDLGYEAEEENTDDLEGEYKKYLPLVYLGIKQPNAFVSRQQFGKRIQISFFDFALKISGPEYLPVAQVPAEEDFPISLLETKSGVPDPSTGILPAFFTFKYVKAVGKSATIDIELSKPTKILCCMSRWAHSLLIKDKVLEAFKGTQKDLIVVPKKLTLTSRSSDLTLSQTPVLKPAETYNKFLYLKSLLKAIQCINIKCNQIIFSIKSNNGHEVKLGMGKAKSQLTLSTRPDKLNLICSLHCVTLSIIKEHFKKLILNPWTISLDMCFFWEAWQNLDADPQIQITAESDCIVVDVSPEQMKSLEVVVKEIQEFLSFFPSKGDASDEEEPVQQRSVDKEQYYKDDLRAGAFQFVDANSDSTEELPLPYQVIFWSSNICAMAWRYPQPRALTKVRVFPVPYKMTVSAQDNLLVLCNLEFWSEVRNCYLPFTEFYLSESEVCYLNLPNSPRPVVASIWRVIITTVDNEEDSSGNLLISPRALAACMRIDSYFNKSLIPNVTAAFYLTKVELALYNYCDKNIPMKMMDYLKSYKSDSHFPDAQKFLVLSLDNLTAFVSNWEFNILSMEVTTTLKVNILDYLFLTEQAFIEPFTSKLELDISENVRCNFISKSIQIKFGPSIAHTLAIASQIWHQNYNVKDNERDFIIMTHYVICNDSNINIRFGQSETNENILLPSREFHLYSWRSQKKKQQLKVALEENEWIWSKSFSICNNGTQIIQFRSEHNLAVLITIKSLSASQKTVTISGQLTVSNRLMEHFEMKLVEAVKDNKEAEFRNAPTYVVASKSNTPSIFINGSRKYFLRLRFFGLDSAWTGDIPLKEHSNGSQPWLVKVPLQERGQFLSIWCRIVTQDFKKVKRVLAMLWPLFTVKSNLPFNSKVHIETPTLSVHLDSIVNGKGELQQLYCPGTIDHSHQLTFKIDKTDPTSNPYVPLNYSLVDQQTFFKKAENEDIDDILEVLRTCDDSKWPYFDDDELKDIEWVIDERPLTHVQVRYQNSCRYSSSLLVELLPWSLAVNTLGVPITLMMNGLELCRIQHNGIIAPPKLEESFHIGVCAGGTWCYSEPLQLSKSDWSQSFYMPKISGNIPLDGTIKTVVKFDSHVSMLSLTSSISNEIRLLKISSTHVLSSHMPMQVRVICIAVPEGDDVYDFPENVEPYSFTVPPHLQKNQVGISIIQWYTVSSKNSSEDYVLYMAFSIDSKLGWSCPIRVDKPFLRRPFCVLTQDHPLALVLTSQEHKGQMFIAIHNDNRPQMVLENHTGTMLFCGQATSDGSVAREAQHFKWNCRISEMGCIYYTMPLLNEKFPELPQNSFSEKIAIACDPENVLNDFEWSSNISITHNKEQFVRIPYFGDIKVVILNTACTTFITLESVSQLEISAKDIRVRLSMREAQETKISERSSEPMPNISKPYSIEETIRAFSDACIPTRSKSLPLCQTILSSDDHSEDSVLRRWSETNLTSALSKSRYMIVRTIQFRERWTTLCMNIFLKSVTVVLLSDLENDGQECWEVASFVCDNVLLNAVQTETMKLRIAISDIQFDNQLYSKESYDFPVVLIGQDKKELTKLSSLNVPFESLVEDSNKNILLLVDCVLETWRDFSRAERVTGVKSVKVTLNPLSCYVEDTYITRLMEYLQILMPNNLVVWPERRIIPKINITSGYVAVPELISWHCAILARPLTIRTISIAPLSLLLSVHSSIKMYIALDQSPLSFGKFERRRLFTTPYRLGHALTMHYLSGAIFGAGWVVSSLELLGSPGGLARAMGTGLRDFVSLPYRGLVVGPMAFLKGITQGSASLMKHVTAGTLQSVTKLASSVARNLDRLTLDEEHLKRTEEQRRQKPQGLAQGFMQGLTGLGISLLGAVGGIAHHPLQSMMSNGPSASSLAAGVGLGIVGMVTKPLSGAAELVALTGQGLLQGAGWNSFPEPRNTPTIYHISQNMNSTLKYNWKHTYYMSPNQFMYIIEATSITSTYQYQAIALVLTAKALIVINTDNDIVEQLINLSDFNTVQNNDPTVLAFKLTPPVLPVKNEEEEEGAIEMDPVSRARVADYVKSTVGLLNLPEAVGSLEHSQINISPLSSPDINEENTVQENTMLTFYVNPQNRNYFLCLLSLAKQQLQNYNFPVL